MYGIITKSLGGSVFAELVQQIGWSASTHLLVLMVHFWKFLLIDQMNNQIESRKKWYYTFLCLK